MSERFEQLKEQPPALPDIDRLKSEHQALDSSIKEQMLAFDALRLRVHKAEQQLTGTRDQQSSLVDAWYENLANTSTFYAISYYLQPETHKSTRLDNI